ncbi:ricin-type beta-trefoil lectin domain protein [Dactylosporangium sp. NPDC000244]|uniref:ricin-type beta-trefoil lectin domain protein n=1 Tax=Dactylosporangium sp. NPDC000244 TaxID=3154365 RepID=UPI00331AD843
MRKHRSRGWLAVVLSAALAAVGLGVQIARSTPAVASTTQVDSGVIGWDGDLDAAIAHRDGSFDIRAGKNITVGFGIYNNPSRLQWFNAGGYYPALTTQFERDNCTVTITNFADEVTIGGNRFVAAYSRVTVANHDSVPHTENPAPSSSLLALNSPSTTVAAGRTVNFDYVIAIDKFGGSYAWPSNAALTGAGGYDTHYAHMTSYWDGKLAQIAQISAPDPQIANAYKAGYIYTNIIKDGNNLNVGENGYDRLYDHDLVGIMTNLFDQGDLSNATSYLQTLLYNEYPDALYKYSWPWAVYLEKTGNTAFVQQSFAKIQQNAHAIAANATGPGGIMKLSNAIDSDGYWTLDNESALMGLLTYKYIATRLGNTTEANWAASQYQTLLAAVNAKLNATISANHLSYLPCAMDVPNSANACGQPGNANWASTFLFGRWSWDGQLWGGSPGGPMTSMIDATYDYGFTYNSGLPAHTYGGYNGYSTAYNAGYGSAGLSSTRYRAEGIYDYLFMIQNAQSAPYSWWEGIPSAATTNWSPGTHATSGTGSGPHMWGQANNSKVLLDSLIAEKSNGSVIVGRGVPTEWLRSGQSVSVSNYPIAGGRAGATISASGSSVTLTMSGKAPSGGIQFSVPEFIGNIASASAGTVDNANGVVALPAGTTSVTVTLNTAPAYTQLGGVDLQGYCQSIGHAGAGLDGTTSSDWRCVTYTGSHISINMDDACQRQYPHNAAAFSASSGSGPYTWGCQATSPKAHTGLITGYQGLCVDVRNGTNADSTPVQVYTCNGTLSQQWAVITDGTLHAMGKCLDVSGGSTANGTPVQLYTCNQTGAQQWRGQSDGSLVNPQSGRCLDDNGGGGSGTQLQIRDCNGGATQKWNLP